MGIVIKTLREMLKSFNVVSEKHIKKFIRSKVKAYNTDFS